MDLLEKIANLAKRRGFVYPGSEIYGGLANTWDYGPYGVELKNNIKKAWWRAMVYSHENIVGLDSAILMNPKTWQASGHLESFTDVFVECKNCKSRFREDHLYEGRYGEVKTDKGKPLCPKCGGELTIPRKFNLMFKTFIGPAEDTASTVYLRPETAQGIFVDFLSVLQSSRQKIPFGIAQIGKSFRNEITPGNFIFRTREFEQMELEFFVEPKTAKKWHSFWIKERYDWYLSFGMQKKNLRVRHHSPQELAHYSAGTADIEYRFPFDWGELEGVANRTDYDLKRHSEVSGKDLSYFDDETKKRYVPYVIEPSAGVDRSLLAFLADAYYEEKDEGGEMRVVLELHPYLAPVKAAVLPLVKNKKPLTTLAKKIFENLKSDYLIEYDEVGSIGRRYRRQDEIGTPYCVTVDFDSLKKKDATVRDRNTMKQKRLKIDKLGEFFKEKISFPV